MRLIAVAFLAVLVSSATLRQPLPPPRQLSHNVGKQAKTVIDSIRLIQEQIIDVKERQQSQALHQLKGLITQAEWRADQLLLEHGRTDVVSAVHQAAQALHALADGSTDVEAGLQLALTDILMVLHQLGASSDVMHHLAASSDVERLGETTPKSTLDVLLEEFQALVDIFLPLLGPIFGLSEIDSIKIARQVDEFVADTEALEHGQVDVTDGLTAMITDILEILKLLGIDWTAPTDETPTPFDGLLADLEAALDSLLDTLGPLLNLTDEQVQIIEADIDTLIKDIEAVEHGEIDVDGGLENILQDLINILHDFDVYSPSNLTVEATTPKSDLDKLLEEIEALIDQILPILAPLIGLTDEQVQEVIQEVDKFVTDTEALEHGQVDVPDGLVAMMDDILEILKTLGIDWTAPTDDTPTEFDAVLAELQAALDALLETLGPLLDLTEEQIQAIEADNDALIKDIEAIEHGDIDVDGGLEQILQDIVNILQDFAVNSSRKTVVEATTDTPSTLDQLLEELETIVDQYLPVLGPLFGLTDEQIATVTTLFDKFVVDVEALEHDTVDVSTGVEDIVTDLIEILRALGIDTTLPTDDTPTDLDSLLAQLESQLDSLLDSLGPILGLTQAQIQQAEADIDTLIKDIEDIEHGHIDVDSGLEKIVVDIFNILKDFGLPVLSTEIANPTMVGRLTALERHLADLVTSLPPAARATVRADLRQVTDIFHQLGAAVPVRS